MKGFDRKTTIIDQENRTLHPVFEKKIPRGISGYWLLKCRLLAIEIALTERMKFKHLLLIDDDEDDQELFIEATKEISEDIHITVVPDASIALERLTKKP